MNASATIYRRNNYSNFGSVMRITDKMVSVEEKKAAEKLDSLASGSARVILDVKAVFPFNFFPDELIVDETKVSVHANYFFFTKEVRSIEFKDIFNVVIRQGVLFASLEVVDKYFSEAPIVVSYMKKKDAILARRIIQGLIIAKKENINTRILPLRDLKLKLERIGQTR
jgi:phosphorylcholine metabolism protein LicD